MWYLALLFDELKLDPNETMNKNIAKLKARYPEKFSKEKALNRDLEKEREILEGWYMSKLKKKFKFISNFIIFFSLLILTFLNIIGLKLRKKI